MTRLKRQWEEIKEMGFNMVSAGIIAANGFTFYMMATRGIYQIWEPNKIILSIECGLDILYFIWACERIYMDGKRIKKRRQRGEL